MEQVLLDYLKLLNIPASKTWFRKQVASHPEYPSILSFSDALNQLGIEHVVAKVEKEQLEDLAFPYLLYIEDGGGTFLPIRNRNDLAQNESELEKWSGIVLMAEKPDEMKNEDHQEYLRNERLQKGAVVVLFGSLVALFGLVLLSNFACYTLLLVGTAIAGAGIGLLLAAKELGVRYEAVEAFCNSGKSTNCDRVLASDEATLFGEFTLSDAVLGYFLFQLAALFLWLIQASPAPSVLPLLLALSLVSLPVVGYSIYLQGWKLQSWCRLCLLVSAVLVIQTTLFGYYSSTDLFEWRQATTGGTIQLLLLLLTAATATFLLKSGLQEGKKAEEGEMAAKRVKYSPEVFFHMLTKERQIDTKPIENEIVMGWTEAPMEITMAASLHCKPCQKGFEGLADLVDQFPDLVKANIRLNVPPNSNKEEKGTIMPERLILNHWFYQNLQGNGATTKIQEIIKEWYEISDIDRFLEQYPVMENGNRKTLDALEKQMFHWFKAQKIQGTPTYFLNGYAFPMQYKIEDLNLLIPALADRFERRAKIQGVFDTAK